MTSSWRFLLAILGAAAFSKDVVIRNVNVVRMDTGAVDPKQTVVVRGRSILYVGPQASPAVPKGSTVIDGKGRYLLPGLADMHAHLAEPLDPAGMAEAQLMLFLANGVTTIRSMRGFPNHLRLRERVRAGELLGPEILVAGPGMEERWPRSIAGAEEAVSAQKRQGYDLLKILPGLPLPVYDAVAKAAKKLGIPFAGHVPAAVGLPHALQAGQQTIEHLDGHLETADAVQRTVDAGAWNVATMAVMETNLGLIAEADLLKRPELEYVPEAAIAEWLRIRAFGNPPRDVSERLHQKRMSLLKSLRDSNARILFGTDSPQLFNVPGFSIHREMRLMLDAGLTPLDILRAATVRAGEYAGKACGEVKAGQCADLLLVDANPIADLCNLRRVAGVMKSGRWLSAAEMNKRLREIRNLPGNYRLNSAAFPRKT